MIWKQVHYIKRNRFPDLLPNIPLEQVFTEDILVDDLVVIVWDSCGLYTYYRDIEMYLKYRFQHIVADTETDIVIVDLGDV